MFNSKALLAALLGFMNTSVELPKPKSSRAALLGFMNTSVKLPKPKSSREAIGMLTYTRLNGTHGSTRRRRFKSLKAKGRI
jgi:hypothetical protein